MVRLKQKDTRDLVNLLSACEVRPGDDVFAIGLDRVMGVVVGSDWAGGEQ